MTRYRLIRNPEEVLTYLQEIVKCSDQHRLSLGFFAPSVYEKHIRSGEIWVAAKIPGGEYSGHLMFGANFPRLTIFQLLVHPLERGTGLGKYIIDNFVEHGTQRGYDRIKAGVAADLPANAFWERHGFFVVKTQEGKRPKNHRLRYLETDSLLSLMEEGYQHKSPVMLKLESPDIRTRVYVIDINVLLDLTKRRVYRDAVARFFAAGMQHVASIKISPEFIRELERTSNGLESDPILQIAKSFPALPVIDETVLGELTKELRSCVFPDRSMTGRSAVRDLSDLKHLAYSVYYRSYSFVTREKAILRAMPVLKELYGLSICSPEEFVDQYDEQRVWEYSGSFNGVGLKIEQYHNDLATDLKLFFNGLGLKTRVSSGLLDLSEANVKKYVAKYNDRIAAFAAWQKQSPFKSEYEFCLQVDESCPAVEAIMDHFFEAAQSEGSKALRRLRLSTSSSQANVIELALLRGYIHDNAEDNIESLVKISKAGYVTAHQWGDLKAELFRMTNWELDDDFPECDTEGIWKVSIKSAKTQKFFTLFSFETILSPLIVAHAGRSAFVLPIQKTFCDELLGLSRQRELFGSPEAQLRIEKAYFRHASNYKKCRRGSVVIFYESQNSGGSGEVIGVGRVTSSTLVNVDEVSERYSRQGVLNQSELVAIAKDKGKVHVITFDNFQVFSCRIPFAALSDICQRVFRNRLQTLTHIASDDLMRFMERGFE